MGLIDDKNYVFYSFSFYNCKYYTKIIQEKTLFPTNNYNMLIMQNINTVQSFLISIHSLKLFQFLIRIGNIFGLENRRSFIVEFVLRRFWLFGRDNQITGIYYFTQRKVKKSNAVEKNVSYLLEGQSTTSIL